MRFRRGRPPTDSPTSPATSTSYTTSRMARSRRGSESMAIPFRQQDELRKRIEKFFLLIAAFYVVLLLRLVYLQAVQGAYFHDRATSMREEQIPLKAQR